MLEKGGLIPNISGPKGRIGRPLKRRSWSWTVVCLHSEHVWREEVRDLRPKLWYVGCLFYQKIRVKQRLTFFRREIHNSAAGVTSLLKKSRGTAFLLKCLLQLRRLLTSSLDLGRSPRALLASDWTRSAPRPCVFRRDTISRIDLTTQKLKGDRTRPSQRPALRGTRRNPIGGTAPKRGGFNGAAGLLPDL